MADNREETVAHFQAVVGLEDADACRAILEEYHWNLDVREGARPAGRTGWPPPFHRGSARRDGLDGPLSLLTGHVRAQIAVASVLAPEDVPTMLAQARVVETVAAAPGFDESAFGDVGGGDADADADADLSMGGGVRRGQGNELDEMDAGGSSSGGLWTTLTHVPVLGHALALGGWLLGAVTGGAGGEGTNPRRVAVDTGTQFVGIFEEEYGDEHVQFVSGSFRTAAAQARSRNRPLLVYLHSEVHQATDTFCTDVLCNDSVAGYLDEHFVVWAGSIQRGTDAFQLNQQFQATTYPFVVVFQLSGNVRQVLDVVEGETDADAFLAAMQRVVAQAMQTTVRQATQVAAREGRSSLREEQEREYQEALAADQARERAEREAREQAEREAREQAEREAREEAERMEAEREQARLEAEREERRASLRNAIAAEPEAEKGVTTTVCVHLPDGERLKRRFLKTDTVQDVLNFIDTKDVNVDEYVLVSNYPRKEFREAAVDLETAGLVPQAMLYLQEK